MKWQHIKIISLCTAVTVFIGVQTKIIWQSFSVHIYSIIIYLSWQLKFFPFISLLLHQENMHFCKYLWETPQNEQISSSFYFHTCFNSCNFSSSWLWSHKPAPSISDFYQVQPLWLLLAANCCEPTQTTHSWPQSPLLSVHSRNSSKEESHSSIRCASNKLWGCALTSSQKVARKDMN